MKSFDEQLVPKVAVQLVRSLMNYADRKGVSRKDMLHVISLTEEQLNDTRLLIDVFRYETLIEFIGEALQDQCLGFHHGQQYEVGRWGVLGMIASTAKNFEEATQAQYCYQSLSGNMGAPLQFTDGKMTTIQWIPAYNCSYHLSEQIIAGLVSLARDVTNQMDHAPNAVYFTHKLHGELTEYERYFGCPVHFSEKFNGLVIDNKLLAVPLRKSDAEVNKVLINLANTLLEQQSYSSPLEVIKDYVMKTLPTHVPDIEEIAQCLNSSVRSTQRKLQEYGTSYSQVLDSIRKELAIMYLGQTTNTVLYISQRLGFSEQSAFQRAFKRWTGVTPKSYRDRLVISTKEND